MRINWANGWVPIQQRHIKIQLGTSLLPLVVHFLQVLFDNLMGGGNHVISLDVSHQVQMLQRADYILHIQGR